jgi:hypothetical protein
MNQMPKPKQNDESYSKRETVKRRDDALRRALNTPPKPRKTSMQEANRGFQEDIRRALDMPPKPRDTKHKDSIVPKRSRPKNKIDRA